MLKRIDAGCEVTVWDEGRESGIPGELKQYGSDDVSVDKVCAFHDALTEVSWDDRDPDRLGINPSTYSPYRR